MCHLNVCVKPYKFLLFDLMLYFPILMEYFDIITFLFVPLDTSTEWFGLEDTIFRK
jgi:hypothetical protein